VDVKEKNLGTRSRDHVEMRCNLFPVVDVHACTRVMKKGLGTRLKGDLFELSLRVEVKEVGVSFYLECRDFVRA